MAGAFAIGTDLESSGGKEPTIHTTLVGGSGGSTTVVVRAPYFSLVLGATFRGRTGTTPSRVAVPAGFTALTAAQLACLLLLTLLLLAPQLLLLMLKLLAPPLLLLKLKLLAPSAPRIFALEIVDLFLAIAAVLQHMQLRR